jgi:hypothetical protein
VPCSLLETEPTLALTEDMSLGGAGTARIALPADLRVIATANPGARKVRPSSSAQQGQPKE